MGSRSATSVRKLIYNTFYKEHCFSQHRVKFDFSAALLLLVFLFWGVSVDIAW